MSTNPPPIIENLTDDNKKSTMPWISFFGQMYTGDLGTAWTPTFQNLTQVGGNATIAGRYYQLTKGIAYFRVDITPVTNTSATAGTTYIDNLPLQVDANGVCCSVSGTSGGSLGIVKKGDGRIYVPSWTTVTDTVTILGLVEAS